MVKGNNAGNRASDSGYSKYVGQFIFWALITIIAVSGSKFFDVIIDLNTLSIEFRDLQGDFEKHLSRDEKLREKQWERIRENRRP